MLIREFSIEVMKYKITLGHPLIWNVIYLKVCVLDNKVADFRNSFQHYSADDTLDQIRKIKADLEIFRDYLILKRCACIKK